MNRIFDKIKEAVTRVIGYSLVLFAMGAVTVFWVSAVILALTDPCGGSVGC